MKITIISSTGQCGVHEYARDLSGGLENTGHTVQYIGVKHHDNRDLAKKVHQVDHDTDLVIIEYEPAIFWLGGLIRIMAWLRFWYKKHILLSVHEIEPKKYAETRQIQWLLSRPVAENGWFELFFIIPATLDVMRRFVLLRVGLLCMGRLPHTVLVHSNKGEENIRLAVSDSNKISSIPLLVKQLATDQAQARQTLDLSESVFSFIMPGFLFRRKQIVEVIQQLPENVDLWVVGTESDNEIGYLDEIKLAIDASPYPENIKVVLDYDRMEQYLIAADVAIFYYKDGFQSAAASLAIGAGKPCIFSDLSGFANLHKAGLVAHTSDALHQAMQTIQQPECYQSLQEQALLLRSQLAPDQIAKQYLTIIR
ncbi:MAG: hypothetical protein AAF629_13435 [Chloroflexota bacterium]